MQRTLIIENDIFFKEVKEILTSGNDVLFSVNGNSMQPFLSHGDNVLIGPAKPQDLTWGKIILARSKYGYVLHRLIWKSKKYIWLAGDNNLIQLEKIYIEDILGFVKYAEKKKKKKQVLGFFQIFLAAIWFLARPVRLVIHKLKGIFS